MLVLSRGILAIFHDIFVLRTVCTLPKYGIGKYVVKTTRKMALLWRFLQNISLTYSCPSLVCRPVLFWLDPPPSFPPSFPCHTDHLWLLRGKWWINSNIDLIYMHEGTHDLFLAINFKMKLRSVILLPTNTSLCTVRTRVYKFMGVCTTQNMFGSFQHFCQEQHICTIFVWGQTNSRDMSLKYWLKYL